VAEKALQESEERFRQAINATEDGLWEWDIQTNREFFAARWCEIIGYSFDDPEFLHTYNSWAERIHPDDSGRVMSALKNHLEKGTNYDVDYRHRHKSGEYRWQNSKGQAIFDERGKPVKMVGCISDITERKRAEEALRESEDRYRTLAEASPDQIFIVGRDDTMKYINTAALKMFRLPYDQVVGTPRKNLFPPHIADAQDISLKKIFETGEKLQTEEKIQFGTQEFWVDTSFVPLKDKTGNVTGVLGIARDITGRKRVEDAVRESEERYRTLTEASPDMIFVVDREDTIKFVNTSLLKLLRLPYDQVVGTPRKNLFPPEIADSQSINFKKVFETGKMLKTEEKIQFGTQELWVDTSSVPLKDGAGNVTGILGIARDITERKKTEILLKQFNEELEEKVKARTEELNTSLEEKIVLLREVHHRVKNNLQILISLLNLQSRTITDPQVIAALKESTQRIRAMSMVHEKLYMGSDLAHIDFISYLSSLATSQVAFYGLSPGKVTLETTGENSMLDINTAIPLGLVMNELVSNALKHAFPGDRKGTIRIDARQMEGRLEISIADDGVGLPEGFDWKTAPTLGLRLVNILIEQLSGTIECKKGKGTTFIISVHRENA
jgi:PAS domain S-box-containing protein